MSEPESNASDDRELRKSGIAASPGIAIGRAYLVDRRRLKVPKRRLEDDEIDPEIERFHRAIKKSDEQLERIKAKIAERENDHYNIITAHQLILHDEHLVDETIRNIRDEQINAEQALRKTVEHIKGVFDAIEDDYFRERRSDVDFVGERVLRNLLGRELSVKPPPDAVVVAHNLSPADTAQLYRAAVAGLVTDAGGRTSHTAIVARSHEIPAVVGLEDVTRVANTGDLLIVDGTEGVVILHPTPDTVFEYRERARQEAATGAQLMSMRDLPARTVDGVDIKLMANIDHTGEMANAVEHGVVGVGLFRTEFMFMTGEHYPTEDEHLRQARMVLEAAGDRTVTFRTMDFGADKVSRVMPDIHTEHNPALGLRSIRLCLTEEVRPLFKSQLRGLLRASVHGKMRIMFPMISGVRELAQAREVLDEAREELVRAKVEFDEEIPIGIMIEMPSAVMIAEHLAKRVDFFSIGTNDLIQYTLAVDRVNEHVSYLYDPLHPAILRLIQRTVQAADEAGISVSVCGEMAGDAKAAAVLVGLGLRELSMHAVAVPRIKQVLRTLDVGELETLATRALGLACSADVIEVVDAHLDRVTAGSAS